MPLSLITAQSVSRLAASTGLPLGPERFRPNILIDTGGDRSPEEDWVVRGADRGRARGPR
jgi:uncharacterized protein YcbX